MSDHPDLVQRIHHFISGDTGLSGDTGVSDPRGDFEDLALEVFRFQHRRIEPYRRLCESRGVDPGQVESWRDVPPVPASAFKSLELAAAPAREVFRTSGTSRGGEQRGVHHHPFPHLYRAVIDASFPGFCLPGLAGAPMLSLIPGREQQPDSSLSFMVDHVLERFGGPGSAAVSGKRRLELPAARSWLGARQRDGRPGLVLATGLALVQLLDGLERLGLRFRLPPGSALFETGGLKGRSREVERSELLARLEEHLGLPAERIVGEYGMTELTSQFYTRTLLTPLAEGEDPAAFVGPPWVRVRVLDPSSLEELPEGETGLLAIFDLANVGSAAHLLTEDLGRAGGGGFYLEGRAAGAELRGCSLRVEEMEIGSSG